MGKKFLIARSKVGGESVETSLVTVGLLLIAVIIVFIFARLVLGVFRQESIQSTEESFSLLVSKLEELDSGRISEVGHAYYIQQGFHLFGFNEDPDELRHVRSDAPVNKPMPEPCDASQACVCICDDVACTGEIVECNKGTRGKDVTFDNIRYFVVTDDESNLFNQGKPAPGAAVAGNYLAIFGKWGGVGLCGFGLGVHCWPQGKVVTLKRTGATVEISVNPDVS